MAVDEKREANFLKTCFNGINALSGVGILSVPYALSSGGWLSLISLLLIAASGYFTAHLITRCIDKDPDKIKSYIDIAGHAFGRKGKVVASIFTCLELFFVATCLLIMEGDNLHKLSPNFALKIGGLTVDARHAFVVLSGVIILPSMCLNDLSDLSYVSAGGVLTSLIIVICVFCVGTTKSVGFHGKGRLYNLDGLPTSLSLYMVCYAGHAMFPPIYNSMRKKKQFSMVLLLSFIICTITNLTLAILGYLIYGQNVQSQVTLNLPTENVSSKVAIYTIVAVPIAKFALIVMPIATAIESGLPANYQDSKPTRIIIRTALLVSTVVCAAVFPSFQSVASLSGALLNMVVSFLLPCLCYVKMFQVYRKWGFELAGIVVIILMGVIIGIWGTYSSIAQIVTHV